MAFRRVVLLLLGGACTALAAEGGLRGPAAPEASLNGSTETPANESWVGEAAWLEDLATNASSYDDGAVPMAWNESMEMDPEDMASFEMFLENYSVGANYSFEENGSSFENASLDSMAQWWWHHHHHHHHYHHHHHGYGGGKVLTLFHQTSREAGHSILRSGFRPGTRGWCGGGIYFATSPQATYHKAIGPDSHLGYIIGAKVNVGRVKHMGKTCDRSMTGGKLQGWGYDSIRFNPGDGDEYVVYSRARIVSMWHHRG